MASNEPTTTCTHERAHGTTVCIRCRHEARLAASARRQRMLARAGVIAFGALVVATAGAVAATAVRRSHLAAARQRQVPIERVVVSSTAPGPAPVAPRDSATRVVQQGDAAPHPGLHPAPVAAASTPVKPPFAPVIPLGATAFGDSLHAERTDSSVALEFDTMMLRTRRADKFERFVRATLPMLYGPPMAAALAAMPAGSIAAQGDLLNELPARGVRIPVAQGWAAMVYPETRPGRDGPLVVRYRVKLVPTA